MMKNSFCLPPVNHKYKNAATAHKISTIKQSFFLVRCEIATIMAGRNRIPSIIVTVMQRPSCDTSACAGVINSTNKHATKGSLQIIRIIGKFQQDKHYLESCNIQTIRWMTYRGYMDFVNFTDMIRISQEFSNYRLLNDKYIKNQTIENYRLRALWCESVYPIENIGLLRKALEDLNLH